MWGRIDFGHFPNSRSHHSVNRHRNPALCQIQLKFAFPGRVQEIQIQIQLKTHNSLFTSQAILSYPIGSFESHPSYDILWKWNTNWIARSPKSKKYQHGYLMDFSKLFTEVLYKFSVGVPKCPHQSHTVHPPLVTMVPMYCNCDCVCICICAYISICICICPDICIWGSVSGCPHVSTPIASGANPSLVTMVPILLTNQNN